MANGIDHGARDHATWSASSTEANWHCAGRLAMIAGIPDRENEAAAWGTACHQVSEKCLRSDQDAISFVGRFEKTKAHVFEVDEEMAETAQIYVDYVRSKASYRPATTAIAKGRLQVEQRFSLAALNPPLDAGGTCDAIVIDAGHVEVIDLKGGRGVVVEAIGNMQLRTYALGAMLANPGLDVDRITVTIVQPRAAHKSGRIRSETFHVADLIEWTADLVAKMHEADMARACKQSMIDHGTFDVWVQAYLKAGDHCKFCPAAGLPCPALDKLATEKALQWFEPIAEGQQLKTVEAPNNMRPERIAEILHAADYIKDFLNSVASAGQHYIENGGEVPGFVLVPKQARRKFIEEDEDKLVVELTDALLVDRDALYVKKLGSPAQIEKLLGKSGKDLLKPFYESKSSGFNLVAADKTTREPAVAPVHKFFQPIGD